MENQEIKEANRKAMPMFILLVIAGAAAGGIMGFVIAKYGLHGFSENIERVADVFSTFVAPWMMFTTAVFVPLILSPYYMKTKKMLLSWDGEDEEISETEYYLKEVKYPMNPTDPNKEYTVSLNLDDDDQLLVQICMSMTMQKKLLNC